MDFTFEQEKWLASHELQVTRLSGSQPVWDELRLRFAASHHARASLNAANTDTHLRAAGSFAPRAARAIALRGARLNPVNPTASIHGKPRWGMDVFAVDKSNHGGRG